MVCLLSHFACLPELVPFPVVSTSFSPRRRILQQEHAQQSRCFATHVCDAPPSDRSLLSHGFRPSQSATRPGQDEAGYGHRALARCARLEALVECETCSVHCDSRVQIIVSSSFLHHQSIFKRTTEINAKPTSHASRSKPSPTCYPLYSAELIAVSTHRRGGEHTRRQKHGGCAASAHRADAHAGLVRLLQRDETFRIVPESVSRHGQGEWLAIRMHTHTQSHTHYHTLSCTIAHIHACCTIMRSLLGYLRCCSICCVIVMIARRTRLHAFIV